MRSPSKKMLVYAGLVCAGIMVPAITIVRFRYMASQPSASSYWAPLGVAAFSHIHYVPLESGAQISQQLENAYFAGADDLTRDQRERLLVTSGEFLEACFLADSAEPNLRWREEHGFVLMSRNELVEEHHVGVAKIWGALLDEPFPEQSEPLEWFKSLWAPFREYGDGANKMVSMAKDGDGLVIIAKNRFSPDDPIPDPADAPVRGGDSIQGAGAWIGGSIVAGSSWWHPQRTAAQIISSTGRCTTATVGIIAEFANGERRPILITFDWDPASKTWLLEGFRTSNLLPGSKGTVVLH